jgi:DNA-binding MarR family transcriptional regulator
MPSPTTRSSKNVPNIPVVPIVDVIRPVMQLRAGLDRISTFVLRKKMGFGVSQFRILYVLAYKPHITQKDIADFWDVTEASVSRQMNILEKRGFIGRKKLKLSKPSISPTGKKALDQAMRHTTQSFEKIFKDIGTTDRKTIARLLEKLLEKVKISPPHNMSHIT